MTRPGHLSLRWSTAKKWGASTIDGQHVAGDLVMAWGQGCSGADARLLCHHVTSRFLRPFSAMQGLDGFEFDPSLLEELHRRGYDVTTLRITIQKRAPTPTPTPE